MNISAAAPAYRDFQHTGTISGGRGGDATYASARTRSGNLETSDTTRTYASGRTVDDIVSISRNADGSISRDATITRPNGKVVERHTTLSASVDGVRTVSGSRTDARGGTEQIAGTQTHTATGSRNTLTLTDTDGRTATRTSDVTKSGNVTTANVTATDLAGHEVDTTLIRTQLS